MEAGVTCVARISTASWPLLASRTVFGPSLDMVFSLALPNYAQTRLHSRTQFYSYPVQVTSYCNPATWCTSHWPLASIPGHRRPGIKANWPRMLELIRKCGKSTTEKWHWWKQSQELHRLSRRRLSTKRRATKTWVESWRLFSLTTSVGWVPAVWDDIRRKTTYIAHHGSMIRNWIGWLEIL